jgi:hypothetical protein
VSSNQRNALQTAPGAARFRQAAVFGREAKKFTRPLSEHALGADARPQTGEEMYAGAERAGDLTLLILVFDTPKLLIDMGRNWVAAQIKILEI